MNQTIVLTSRHRRTITIVVEGGIIKSVDNQSGVRFPFVEGQPYNRSVETWTETNNFLFNGRDLEKENRKIYSIRIKDVPQGHPLRMLHPEKFR